MSRLWPEQIRIGLGASYVALATVRGRKVTAWRMQQFAPAAGEFAWQAPMHNLTAWLAELAPRGAVMHVALSAELAPLHLLPWREDVTHAEQQALLAQNHFRQVFGETTASWKTTVQPTGYGAPWLASGVDEGLLQALTEQAQDSHTRLQTVIPLTVSLFNGARRRLEKGHGWMLVAEPEKLVALYLHAGHWQLLRALPKAVLQQEPVKQMLLREAKLAGIAPSVELPFMLTAGHMPDARAGEALMPGWQSAAGNKDANHFYLLGAAV